MRRLTKFGAVIAVSAVSLLAASCSSSSSSPSSSGASGVLTMDNESGGTWSCDFNPFNLSDIGFSLGMVYEPLVFVNTLQNGKTSPWLATSYAWSNGNKTLTFTIRNGVKFSNGDPLNAADVVYTYNLLKNTTVKGTRVLDINGVWSVLSSVTQQGSNQVVMQFSSPAVQDFYFIADQIGIVDQKVWSKISDPAKFPDTNPVGTGPYLTGAKDCTPENIKYVANSHYWQAGLPKVGTVNYPAFLSNDTANTYLAAGSAQWGSQYIPSIKQFYTSKSPDNHYWFPPVANVSIFMNLTNPLLKNLAVRQAMAYAIDRSKAASIGEGGEELPANQTGIVTPTFSSWQDTSQAAQFNYTYDPAKAIKILEAAGFKRGSDGIFAKNGQKLSFTLTNNGGFSDWVAAADVIIADLKAVGIQVTPRDLAYSSWQNAIYTGDFQLGYYAETGGPTPYYEFRQWLYSPNSAPIGTPAGSNFERFNSQAADNLINSYGLTTSRAAQQQIVDKLQLILLQQVPVIPVTESVDWFQYSTSEFTGWPSPSNQYAQPAVYNYPDEAQVLMHLVPKK